MKIPFLKKFKKKSNVPEELFAKEPLRITDIIAPSSLEVKQNYLKVGERFVKSYFIFSYPRYLTTGWLSPIINLNLPSPDKQLLRQGRGLNLFLLFQQFLPEPQ